MNKRAWLHHLGQPGCGRESAGQQPQPHQQKRHRSSSFLGGGRNAADGRAWPSHSSPGGVLSAGTADTGGAETSGAAAAAAVAEQPLFLPAGVGILGCRCHACLTEGEHEHEQQQTPPPPTYEPPSHVPPPYNQRPPPPRYDAVAAAATAVGGHGTVRAAGRTWDDGEREEEEEEDDDDLGMKGSRSYSPASAQGSSPLLEACESYDDDEGVFPTGSYFFYD